MIFPHASFFHFFFNQSHRRHLLSHIDKKRIYFSIFLTLFLKFDSFQIKMSLIPRLRDICKHKSYII